MSTTTLHPAPIWESDSRGDIIIYYPSPRSATSQWNTALDVLSYLLSHPYERDALRDEACRRSPDWPHQFQVYHLFFEQRLTLNSYDSDYEFITTIQTMVKEQEEKSKDSNHPPRPVLFHRLPFIIRNPFGIRIDTDELAHSLGLQCAPLVEVTILPRRFRITPLQY
jgi:hypothetical protein